MACAVDADPFSAVTRLLQFVNFPTRRCRAGPRVGRAVEHNQWCVRTQIHRRSIGPPRRQRNHTDHRRIATQFGGDPSAHRVAQQNHPSLCITFRYRVECGSRVGDRTALGTVPTTHPIASLHRSHTGAAKLSGERAHPKVGQMPGASRAMARDLSSRQHEHHQVLVTVLLLPSVGRHAWHSEPKTIWMGFVEFLL